MESLIMEEKGYFLSIDQLRDRLAILYKEFNHAGDQDHARKIYQLVEKLGERECILAFCGHFSAGKSSLINELMGHSILPSSPIPTSANLVKVKSGQPYARVYMKNQGIVNFAYPYDIEQVKRYCIDGDIVESVEISHPSEMIDMGVTIMDTPGIDSTDEAHRVATESALHLADLIFYVMDYNHVQSELNLEFTRMLSEKNKKVYLIINQIDKHLESELLFAQFKEGVETAFARWNVKVEGIFYTSLKEPYHAENQLHSLKELIGKRSADCEELIIDSAYQAALQLISDHIEWQENQRKEEIDRYRSRLDGYPSQTMEDLTAQYQKLKLELDQVMEQASLFEEQFKNEMAKILNHATIMTFQTRELARLYLESLNSGFKIGFLFSGKKREEEREKRLHQFYNEIEKNALAQIYWPLKQLLLKTCKDFGIADEGYFRSIDQMEVPIGLDLLTHLVKSGANLNGEYLFNYAKEVADALKLHYRKSFLDKLNLAVDMLKERSLSQESQLKEELLSLEQQMNAMSEIMKIYSEMEKHKERLLSYLSDDIDELLLVEARKELSQLAKKEVAFETSIPAGNENYAKIPAYEPSSDSEREREGSNQPVAADPAIAAQLKATAKKLRIAADTIRPIAGFQEEYLDITMKAARLEENQFTLALFGAFSAGKSSFANALLGYDLLPASPNPTTATITRIMPPNEQFAHGTVRIKVKSKEEMLADIQHSLSKLGFDAADFDEAMAIIAKLDAAHLDGRKKTHNAFLLAVGQGYEPFSQLFGQVIETDLSDFSSFVAEEHKAAFIDWIEVYYRSPLSEQGVILVDTPGADSINARHTGVAFEYIKNADAVLFVTYYNHSFSHADREFLIQLGRVKETFAMDKMFFLINAVDLARSSEELGLVIKHVEKNLLDCGIRSPRIYPISSQMALHSQLVQSERLPVSILQRYAQPFGESEEPMTTDQLMKRSGIPKFLHDFYQFAQNDLVNVAVHSALADIGRVILKMHEYIELANEDEELRQQKLRQTNQVRAKVLSLIEQADLSRSERELEQDIDELLYYVKQRLFLRYRDQFKIYFSPAALRNDDGDMKRILFAALDELLQFIRFDLLQEIRATTLRIEKRIDLLLEDFYKQLQAGIYRLDETCSLIPYAKPSAFATPALDEGVEGLDPKQFLSVLNLFKNKKRFFEEGENAKMCDELEGMLQQPVALAISHFARQLKEIYLLLLRERTQSYLKQIQSQILDDYEGKIAALNMHDDLILLESSYKALLNLMDDKMGSTG